jgi:SulP family sulfate permease
VKWEIREQLAAAGFLDAVGEDRVFATLPTAVQAFAEWHRREFGQRPPGIPEATA